ncbi:MAG TPA: hypothetical protein VLN44_09670, partial [Pyrinomonadaceae bacterium]|nr:hypothetical protein [Pyrinomonadaceae bacterium]
ISVLRSESNVKLHNFRTNANSIASRLRPQAQRCRAAATLGYGRQLNCKAVASFPKVDVVRNGQ